MPPAVTPSGVRDGDPAALAGLCAVRGPSVLAYCRHVAGDADAGNAAAEAFASFRAAVVATEDLADLNPEALLIGATRRAAARHAPHADMDVCAVVPLLLAARAERTISIAEREILEQHLETCWHCRAPVARFKAAERAYRDPTDPAMDPVVVTQIIAAMAAAGPPAPALNGAEHPAPEAAQPAAPAPADQAAKPRRTVTTARIPRAKGAAAAPLATVPTLRPARRRGRRGSRGRSRSGKRLPLPIVLPVAVVLLALLVALFVSGVFGGSDPASSPRVNAPADTPADGEPADVVVVPGAEQASPDAVEEAKARDRRRERERARRRREASATRDAAATRPPPPAAAVTPPPVAPVTAPPPPPPPPPARDDGGSGRQVDPGTGATGSEQIPPAEDTSTVPDLAPAPESATAP